ncbi:MAG TPA: Tim44/TimA family putative adaptor protein [Stellaceae bacterium]|jgi:predicted lipid-binding transport protein (Tim44 family)|nr:Tim44/TimA family putative adaptor protein [Stellaceae bacterium]
MGNPYFAIIILALIVLVLIFKLRSVLGRRTGTEKPPGTYNQRAPYSQRPVGGNGGTPSQDQGQNQGQAPIIDLKANPSGGAYNGDPIAAGLAQIRTADPRFNPDSFLQGAAQAFPMIVKAFADGDTAALRRLTSDEVYDTFAEIIRHRLSARESAQSQIVRLDRPTILGAGLDGRTARVDVKFVSSQIFALRDQAGQVVEGDPDHPADRTDIWTFARNTRSSDPNWMLAATAPGE